MKILIFCLTLLFPFVSHADNTIKTFGRGCHTDNEFNMMFCTKLKKREVALFRPINTHVNSFSNSIITGVGGTPHDIDKISVRGKLKSDSIGSSLRFPVGDNYTFTFSLYYSK